MANVRPFEDVPYVTLPGNYATSPGPFLMSMYEQHGPIFRTTYLGKSLVYLVGPEANRFVLLSDRLKFSHHQGWGDLYEVLDVYGNGLLTMDGEEHNCHRRMMKPAFELSSIARYLPQMNRIVRRSLPEWLAMGEIDLSQETRKITFAIVAGALVSMEDKAEIEHFRELFVH